MKHDEPSSVSDAQQKRQVDIDLPNVDKSQGLDAKLQKVPAENEEKPRNNGQTEKLQTILSYYSMNGSFPFTDFKSFHDFVMNSLQSEVSTSEMMSQIEEMKKKYKTMENQVLNPKPSIYDWPEVTELPGMILEYPCLKHAMQVWKVDPSGVYVLFEDYQLEYFEIKWDKLRLLGKDFRLDAEGIALFTEMLDVALNNSEIRDSENRD